MTPIHYRAKILPDGHLPVPEGFAVPPGEEIQITLTLADHGTGEVEGEQAELFERDGLLCVRASGLAPAAAFDHSQALEERIDRLAAGR